MSHNWIVEDKLPFNLLASQVARLMDFFREEAVQRPFNPWEVDFLNAIGILVGKAAEGDRIQLSFRQWRSLVEIMYRRRWQESLMACQIYHPEDAA